MDIHNYLATEEDLALITVKRELSLMVKQGLLTIKKPEPLLTILSLLMATAAGSRPTTILPN